MNNRGEIELILGPMFSGKTSELFRRLNRYTYSKKKCILIKYADDTRYSKEYASTHDKVFYKAVSERNLLTESYMSYDVIGIDEGQFFPEVVSFSDEMANQGKIVLISCLNADFLRKGFDNVLKLIPISESITKLSAVCPYCCDNASFTKRTTEDKEIISIGGSEKYIASCRKCYFNKN